MFCSPISILNTSDISCSSTTILLIFHCSGWIQIAFVLHHMNMPVSLSYSSDLYFWLQAIGKMFTLWTSFARFYERHSNVEHARAIFEKATSAEFKHVDDLASVWCEYAEMEMRRKNYKNALNLLRRATAAPLNLDRRQVKLPASLSNFPFLKLVSCNIDCVILYLLRKLILEFQCFEYQICIMGLFTACKMRIVDTAHILLQLSSCLHCSCR